MWLVSRDLFYKMINAGQSLHIQKTGNNRNVVLHKDEQTECRQCGSLKESGNKMDIYTQNQEATVFQFQHPSIISMNAFPAL